MAKTTYLPSAQVRACKKGKRAAYLIAIRQKCEAIWVYAVVPSVSAAAITQLEGLTINRMVVEVVGARSRNIIQSLGLEPGEMRLV